MSTHIVRRLGSAVLIVGVLAGPTSLGSASAATAAEGTDAALELILDSSGSMAGRDPSGVTKIAAAKHALTGTIDSLPADSKVALRVYGARYKDKARGCTDSQLVLPLGPLDRDTAKAALTGFQPGGYTPIAYSLQQAAKDLPKTGQRTIVLVSDGEETCNADPCAVAKPLAQQGIDLHVDTVGFGVSPKARQQLTCIAQITGGHYYEAPDADSLNRQLGRIAVRAFRTYTPSGTPISGTLDPTQAPVMRPGQYVDSLEVNQTKHYAVDLAKGVTPYVAATVVRPFLQQTSTLQVDSVLVGLATAAGKECGSTQQLDLPGNTVGPQTGYAAFGEIGRGRLALGFNEDDSCGQPGRYVVSISRETNKDIDRDDLPTEIVFVAEPPVKDAASLPAPVNLDAAQPANAPQPARTGTVTPGGGSFGDAPTVGTGTYTDTIRSGETLFYRVKVDWGQRLSYSVQLDPVGIGDYVGAGVEASNPVRIPIDAVGSNNHGLYTRKDGGLYSNGLVPVAYRNRDVDGRSIKPVSLAGYYYLQVQLEYYHDLAGTEVPLRLAVRVDGDPSGQPDYLQAANAADPGNVTDPKPASETKRAAAPASGKAGSVSLRTVVYSIGGGVALLGAIGLILLPLLLRRLSASW